MSKVLTESPRWGNKLRNRKTRLRLRGFKYDFDYDEEADELFDELPNRVSGSRSKHLNKGELKSFSDLISPLYRFLQSNLGRPWDKVYSEMCKHLDTRKTTGNHVFEHLEGMVSTHCYEEDGIIYSYDLSFTKAVPAYEFYVHPRTGLLCWAKRKSPQDKPPTNPPESTPILLGKDCGYFKLEGVWHFIRFQKVPESKIWYYDHIQERWALDDRALKLPKSQLIELPGRKQLLVISKEPLTRQERRAAGLHNDPGTAGSKK